jgi:hypothetical protein
LSLDLPELHQFQTALANLSAAECRALLIAGKPIVLLESLTRAQQRQVEHPEFAFFLAVCKEWINARELADRGDFAAALAVVERTRQTVTAELSTGFVHFQQQLSERHEQFQQLSDGLYAAMEQRRWGEVLRYCEKIISLAPEHREVRQTRSRAWQMLQGLSEHESTTPRSQVLVEPAWNAGALSDAMLAPGASAFAITKTVVRDPLPVARRASSLEQTHSKHPSPMQDVAADDGTIPRRFVLWVDGVGGYLVCLGQRVGLGQATGQLPVDVPLHADVSRLHAEITRDAEGYSLESGREVLVNGNATTRTALCHGDRVTLGATCQFHFQQPVPISPTASLALVSGHRLPLAVDAVLLMAEYIILGPTAPVHVLVPGARSNIVISRSKTGLALKYPGAFKIDQQSHRDRAPLPLPCSVSSDTFSFALEPVGLHS